MSSASSSITPPLLEALMSPDGSIRSQAEAVFQSLSVVDRIQGLLTHLSSSTSTSTSTPGGANCKTHPTTLLAAVLLRRTIVKLDEPGLLQDLVTPLLQAFRSMAMLPLAHCLAQVCASLTLVQPDAVAGVLTTILSTIQAPIQDVGHVPSLQLMAALADQAPVAFAHVAVGSLPHLYTSSGNRGGGGGGWSPAALAVWTEVLVAAAIATTTNTTTATTNLDEWVIDPTGPAAQLAPALEPLLPFLTDDSQDEDARHSVLQHLAHAAVACPSLLAGNPQILPALIQTCLQVATSATTRTHQESLSLAALQVLASLVSVGDVKRRCLTAEQAHAIASTAVPLCVHVMVAHAGDAEDDAAWVHEPATLVEDGMDDDESDEYLFASTLLESFVSQLDALAVLLPHAESLLPPQASDAASVRTGVAVLECALLATPVGLQPHLPVVLQAALTLANPSSSGSSTNTNTLPPRIQYQALRLLGCLCATHPELTCTNRTVLERLTAGVASPISKVSATASLGLVSYCRSSSSNNAHDDVDFDDIANSLVPVLPEIVHALQYHPLSVTATDTGSIAMRVRAMGAVACVAQAVGPITAAFHPYYATLYPGLIASAQQAPTPELAAAALESATLVGQAVGVDVFGPDAHALLQHWILPALMKLQTQTQTNNHFNVEPLLLACARMASVLQEQFAPYLDSVLPLLLARVQEPPDVSIMEGDEGGLSPPSSSSSSQQDSGTESMTVAVPGRGFTKVTINTTKIQEKAQATRAVYELAKAFSSSNSSDVSSFAKWVEPCLQAFLPLVSFAYSADVRSTAAQTLGAVFEVACAVGESSSVDGGSSSTSSGMNLPQTYLPVLATAISNQLREEDTADMDNMYALADSLSEVYYIAYRYRTRHPDVVARFGLEQATVSVDCCRTVMVDCLDRRTQLLRVLQTGALGPDEAQDYTTQLAAEEQLLTPLVDSMGYLLKFMTGSNNDSSSVFVRDVFEPQYASLLQSRLSDQSDVRASLAALCLFDDVVEYGGPAAAQHYAPVLVQGVVTCFQHHPHEPELIQAAVYGIVQLARHVPNAQTVLSSHLPILLHRLLALTNTEKSESKGEPYACEMAAIALGSLTLWGPFPSPKGVSQSTLVEHVLTQCPILQAEDTDAQLCHAALCQLFETGVVDPTRYADRLVPIIGSLLQHVVQEGDPGVATPDTVERLSNLLFHLVSSGGRQVLLQGLSPEVQHVVGAVLNDVATSRSHVVTP